MKWLLSLLVCGSVLAQDFGFDYLATQPRSATTLVYTLIDSQTNDSNYNYFGADANYVAGSSSFIPSQSGALRKLITKLYRTGSTNAVVTCSIHADDGSGKPGSLLGSATNTVLQSDLALSPGAEVEWYFDAGINLTASTTNHFSLAQTNLSADNYTRIRKAVGTSASDTTCRRNSSGTWYLYYRTNQCYFKSYYLLSGS